MTSSPLRQNLSAPPITPGALSVNSAAEYLSISRAGLYRIFKSGALKPARIGGRTVVRRVDLDDFLTRAMEEPAISEAAR